MKVSKNRQANELRAKADALVSQIADPSKDFNPEEIDRLTKEITALKSRANAIDEFTPEAAAAERGLEVATPETIERAKSLKEEVDDLAKDAYRAFGGMKNYLKAASGLTPIPSMTDEQKKIFTKAMDLTKSIVGTTGDASGGEFLLPLQQADSIFTVDNTMPGILQVAKMFPTNGRSLRIPYAEQSTGSVARPLSGIANVTIIGEGSTKTQLEPIFAQRTLTVYKYAGYSQIGDELLSDDFTGQAPAVLTQLVGGQCMNAFNEDITISGNGSGAPLGALNASNTALYSVTRTVSGSVGLSFADLKNMWVHHVTGQNSRWLVSRSELANLMSISGSQFTNWMTNLQADVPQRLFGIPVIITDILPAAGTANSIGLVNGDYYAAAIRKALSVESSQHYAFINDLTTYRFVFRAGGIPLPTSTYSYKATGGVKTYQFSPFVGLSAL